MLPSTTDAHAVRERLIAALLSDKGLDHLVAEAAEALGNPVFVVDPTHHYVARAGIDLADDDESAFARLMRQELVDDAILDEGIEYIAQCGIDLKLAHARSPLVMYNELCELNTMTKDVTVHGVCLGRVMMVEHDHAFSDDDPTSFSLLASLIGQELQKGVAPIGGQASREGSFFLSRLLDDEQPNPISTARRMRNVDFQPLPQLFIVVIARKDGILDVHETERIRAQAQALLVHGIATHHEGRLVALISRATCMQLPSNDEDALAGLAATNDVHVGISNAFAEITDARSHLKQADAALYYGSTFTKVADDTGVYRYCEYVYMEMLDLCNDRVNLMNYVHPSIWRLWQHDNRHDSELVETLFAYIQNASNTARTADLLSIHKNTLLYRLSRIKEICDNDLTSGEDLFLFHISIRTLIYMGFIECRTKPRSSRDLHSPSK